MEKENLAAKAIYLPNKVRRWTNTLNLKIKFTILFNKLIAIIQNPIKVIPKDNFERFSTEIINKLGIIVIW